MKICYKLDDRIICFPLMRDPWWWLQDNPWTKLQPDPWVIDKALKSDVLKSIEVIAAIEKLTQDLSPELREQMHGAIKDVIKRLKLPREITVEL